VVFFAPRFRRPHATIRGTHVGLRKPSLVDVIKAAMRDGTYAYQEMRGRIAGVRDGNGIYHFIEGHHRMAAAFEMYQETGDSKPINDLVMYGQWAEVERRPACSRPLPARSWWRSLRNRVGL
jgi:filamentous hemagglutinin